MLPHGGNVGLEKGRRRCLVWKITWALPDGCAGCPRSGPCTGQVGPGRACFREGIDIQVGVSQAERRPNDPVFYPDGNHILYRGRRHIAGRSGGWMPVSPRTLMFLALS